MAYGPPQGGLRSLNTLEAQNARKVKPNTHAKSGGWQSRAKKKKKARKK